MCRVNSPLSILTIIISPIISLAACSSGNLLAKQSRIQIQTHRSGVISLDPVSAIQKTIYIGVRNTSDYPVLDLRTPLVQAITARGYTVVDDPAKAHYMLQANVLQAGKLDPNQTGALLSANYGQPLLAGAAAGALTGAATGNGYAGLGVGLGVGAATWAFNQAYKDVTYAVTTDIQISERPLGGGKVHQHTHNVHGSCYHASSYAVTDATPTTTGECGTDTLNTHERTQDMDEENNFKQYQVRDVAYASKANLKLDEAVPTLVQHLTSSLATIFSAKKSESKDSVSQLRNGEARKLEAVRAFLKEVEIPPQGVGAYGIVALRAKATSSSIDRLAELCQAYLSSIPSEQGVPVSLPPSDRMLTIWPVDNSRAVTQDEKTCEVLLEHYDLYSGLLAINDARAQGKDMDGPGPFLIGWAPSSSRYISDAVVLVIDMSELRTQADFDNALLFWQRRIVENPALWRGGFSTEGVRLAIRNFVDHYGSDILRAIDIGKAVKPAG